MKLLLVAAFAACFVVPAFSAECLNPFDETIGNFSANGGVVKIIDPSELPAIAKAAGKTMGHDIGEVTRGFVVAYGGVLRLGLEVDGCLLPPINLGPVSPAVEQLSGKGLNGQIGA